MPLDPVMARGIAPLGAGIADTLLSLEDLKRRDANTAELSRRTDLLAQGQQFDQQQISRESQLREKLAELVQYDGAPPEIAAAYIAQQKAKHPEFAQTPFAQMEPTEALRRMRTGIEAQLGITAKDSQQPTTVNFQDAPFGAKVAIGSDGRWSVLEAPKAPTPPAPQARPSSVEEWEYFNSLPPDQQQRFLQMKRANATPEIAAATTTATEGAKAGVERATAQTDREAAWNLYETAMAGLQSGLSATETGPLSGRIPAVTSAQQTGEGAVAAMAPVLKQLFRTAGEGTFTDRDQALLLEMVPTRKDTPEARAAKIANIDSIVRAKLRMSPKSSPAQGEAPPQAVEHLRKNPQLKEAFRAKYGYVPDGI